ncbi:hypothetical protein G6011_10853 [Alternaria panax]|uniref:DUF7626 domain-containing protein n=1 Tax=Alternaria panax TaxID=48097 RepID=A0AAD4ICN7_9PLEO|nr:hypothetical protein G6011_10853 [Alternaria panax]
MTDDTLIFDSGEPLGHIDFEEGLNDDDNFIEDAAQAADDSDDGDFKLDGFDDLSIPQDDEDEADDYDPEYDDNTTRQKRKRTRPNGSSKTTKSLQRSLISAQTDNAEAFILDEDNDFLYKQPSRVPGTFGRRDRRKGESLPAYHKRVSHELDSDDELMMQMREKGFSDRQIADKLASDGRVRYDQKSISTRIMRIRLAQADNVNFLLKEGYKEWEYADDELLIQAHALADIEINYEIERIRAWRFRKVSEYMRRLNKDALFSALACRERYNAIVEGTARIPTEVDDDPDARRAEMENFRMTREKTRNEEKAKQDALDATEAKTKSETKSRNAQKAEEIANKRANKESEKAHRAMTRAAQAQIRAARAIENVNTKAQRNNQLKNQTKARETRRPVPNTNVPLARTNTIKVPSETPDPRSYLSVPDLQNICEERGLDLPRKKNKDSFVQALINADDEYSQNDLKKMCRAKGLNANGSESHMKHDLALAEAQTRGSYDRDIATATAEDDRDDEMDMDE